MTDEEWYERLKRKFAWHKKMYFLEQYYYSTKVDWMLCDNYAHSKDTLQGFINCAVDSIHKEANELTHHHCLTYKQKINKCHSIYNKTLIIEKHKKNLKILENKFYNFNEYHNSLKKRI